MGSHGWRMFCLCCSVCADNTLSMQSPLHNNYPRARMRNAAKGYCSLSVGRFVGFSLSTHVFSRTVAAVDTKRGYVGMCNGRSAQQESGAALSENSMFTAGA